MTTRTLRLTTSGWALVVVSAYRLLTLIATLSHRDSITQLHKHNTASSVFAWWDGQWYLRIAQYGYNPAFVQHSVIGNQTEAAFPPALAALMGGTHHLLGIDLTVAGLIWCFVALAAIGVGLVQLVERDYGRRVALLTLAFLLLWPPAFFFGMLYQDGITLAGVVWAFVLVRRRHPALAGVALGIACLGKIVAAAAVVALVVDYLHETAAEESGRYRRLGYLVAGPVVAIGGWLLYSGIRFHNLTAAFDAERGWEHELTTPWHSISVSIDALHKLKSTGYQAVLVGDFIAVGLMLLAIAYLAFRRARPSYVVYTATMFLALTCNGNTVSVDRYVLLVFTVFLAAALAVDRLLAHRRALGVAVIAAAVAMSVPAQLWLIERFARYYWAG
ncbi:MAG: hypothetical protein QOD07_1648 [Frankiaceae bacterium]|jgi:hypothetical protein|nr:hypothetical protein [Frankiaceae bacterium]